MGRTVPDVHTLVATRPVSGLSLSCTLLWPNSALAVNARTQCGPGSSLCQRADGAAAFAIGCADGGGPVPMLRRLRSSRLAVLIASVVIGSLLLITGHLDGFKLVATTSAGSEVLPNAAPARVHTCTQVYILNLPAPCVHSHCAMHSEPFAHFCTQLA